MFSFGNAMSGAPIINGIIQLARPAAAGIFLGAAGAGDVGSAVIMGSMAAGQSAMLAYSREDELQADQMGLVYLYDAGYGGEGLLNSLKTIRSKQWFGTEQVPNYLMTHPASEDRMANIDVWLEGNQIPQLSHIDAIAIRITDLG